MLIVFFFDQFKLISVFKPFFLIADPAHMINRANVVGQIDQINQPLIQVRHTSPVTSPLGEFFDRALRVGVIGYDRMSLARQFCQLSGVEIPYRCEIRYGTKERGPSFIFSLAFGTRLGKQGPYL